MLKRLPLALAAFLLAATAFGQAVVPPVSDADRTTTYNVNSSTSVFSIPFPVYGDCSDLTIVENGQAVATTAYVCASASGRALSSIARPITDLQITLVTPMTSGSMQITSFYRPRNLFVPTAPGITRTEFERTINGVISGMRDLYHAYGSFNPPPQIWGQWSIISVYPQNAVVGYAGSLWQASQASVAQVPAVGSSYWTLIQNPPATLSFANPEIPGAATNIAGASTVDIGTIPTHFASVSGAATISSFGSSCPVSSPIYYVTFASADIITYNATSLITPGARNITTSAGDSAVMQCLGGGNWRILSFSPASGPSTPPGSVMAFNLSACPLGWIAADGTNGTPNLRGYFVRGLDTGSTIDPGRTLASTQGDTVGPHTHQTHAVADVVANVANAGAGNYGVPGTPGQQLTTNVQTPAGTTETRPKNVALLYCQKQ